MQLNQINRINKNSSIIIYFLVKYIETYFFVDIIFIDLKSP